LRGARACNTPHFEALLAAQTTSIAASSHHSAQSKSAGGGTRVLHHSAHSPVYAHERPFQPHRRSGSAYSACCRLKQRGSHLFRSLSSPRRAAGWSSASPPEPRCSRPLSPGAPWWAHLAASRRSPPAGRSAGRRAWRPRWRSSPSWCAPQCYHAYNAQHALSHRAARARRRVRSAACGHLRRCPWSAPAPAPAHWPRPPRSIQPCDSTSARCSPPAHTSAHRAHSHARSLASPRTSLGPSFAALARVPPCCSTGRGGATAARPPRSGALSTAVLAQPARTRAVVAAPGRCWPRLGR